MGGGGGHNERCMGGGGGHNERIPCVKRPPVFFFQSKMPLSLLFGHFQLFSDCSLMVFSLDTLSGKTGATLNDELMKIVTDH